MTRSLLSTIAILGLLASGDVCSWLCAGGAEVAVEVPVSSHCGGGPAPEPAGDEPRSHDDCPGCALAVAANSGSLHASAAGFGHDLPLALAPLSSWESVDSRAAGSRLTAPYAERLPPRDVLALTTSLRI